ncbi:MAG: stage II sporulation protein P, partial [Lysinibacillus sp.]
AGQLPLNKQESSAPPKQADEKPVVYAATSLSDQNVLEKTKDPFNVLLMFTHSHEAYEPMVKQKTGKIATSDATTNIFNMQDTFKNHFSLNGLQTEVLDVDVMKKMKAEGKAFHQAYSTIRPYISKQLEKNNYDLILDLHRDSLKWDRTTVTYNGEAYAKIAIVVGKEHANYRWNTAYAESLSKTMNSIVPNISRGVISKGGDGVDGRYNQDLSKEMLIIELGGIGNNEEEVNRTIAVLARAISTAFGSQSVQ